VKSVVFGGQKDERLEIKVRGYERAPVGDRFDDNWLSVEVFVQAGAFTGSFSAAFLTGELRELHEQIVPLHASLKGVAKFRTLEEQLSFSLAGTGRGTLQLEGNARDRPGSVNTMSFSFALDQTQLHASERSLAALLAEFPERL
jgi:hypothetical protein